MAYTILKTNGTVLARVADASINTTATSLTLVGRDYSGFGQYYNQNMVTLLSNSSLNTPPVNPIQGQLWYDTATKKIKVYDGSFASVSAVTIAPNPPAVVGAGDFWYDASNEVLNFMDPYGNYVSVTAFARDNGPSPGPRGWIYPLVRVQDNTTAYKDNVTLLYNGVPTLPISSVGVLSDSAFTASTDSTARYFAASGQTNATIVNGLNIFGGLQVTGDVTVNSNSTLGTPGNTATPAKWLKVLVGSTTYYTPLYQ